MSNAKLKIQKAQLSTALNYATIIETCDNRIEAGSHIEYYKGVRAEAITSYADAIAAIIENSIDIAVEFDNQAKNFHQMLLKEIDIITNDYRKTHNIT